MVAPPVRRIQVDHTNVGRAGRRGAAGAVCRVGWGRNSRNAAGIRYRVGSATLAGLRHVPGQRARRARRAFHTRHHHGVFPALEKTYPWLVPGLVLAPPRCRFSTVSERAAGRGALRSRHRILRARVGCPAARRGSAIVRSTCTVGRRPHRGWGVASAQFGHGHAGGRAWARARAIGACFSTALQGGQAWTSCQPALHQGSEQGQGVLASPLGQNPWRSSGGMEACSCVGSGAGGVAAKHQRGP